MRLFTRLLPGAAAHRRRPLATRIVARVTPSDGSSGPLPAPSPSGPSTPSPSGPECLPASTEASVAELRRIAAAVEALAAGGTWGPGGGSDGSAGGGGGSGDQLAALLRQLAAVVLKLTPPPQQELRSDQAEPGPVAAGALEPRAASDPAASAPELHRMLGAAVEALGERQAAAAAEHTALLGQILAQKQEASAQQAAAQTALLEQQAQHLAALRRDAVTARLQAALAVQCGRRPPENSFIADKVLMAAIRGKTAEVPYSDARDHGGPDKFKEYLEGLTGFPVSYKTTGAGMFPSYTYEVECWKERGP
ncbi:hypothetical protein HYH03_002801 [Edaphochlamys debaryana]|uniref:Uncharacterized protein n=1 Tax=Edaphochlamys debaryana TaxID=47281 RepID=A0A835YE52_9CHLO|nr:hypothetical protein HYH03_002801 [Edaphochlamys debaryana]|eukprot:KAG2499221.1 hypothetical protein HYH03_002801 [Edaphochlamys debaryana]